MDANKAFDHYRQHLSRMVKRSTREDYNKRLAMLSTFCSMQGTTAIEDIDFTQFLDWLYLERGIAPRTRNNYRTWACSFCEWCRQREYLEGNPLEGIKPLREPQKMRQPLTASDLNKVKHYLERRDKHFLLAVMLEYYTFIRPGELSNIRIGDMVSCLCAIFFKSQNTPSSSNAVKCCHIHNLRGYISHRSCCKHSNIERTQTPPT